MAAKLIKMAAQAAQAAVVLAVALTTHTPELLARLTQAVAVVVVVSLNLLLPQLLENQAAPAS